MLPDAEDLLDDDERTRRRHDAGKCDPDVCSICETEQLELERAAPPKKRVYRFTIKAGDAVAAQFIDDDGKGVLAQLEAACEQLRADEMPELNFSIETGEMTDDEFGALPEFDDGAV